MISDVFCKIINKELPAEVIYENDNWLVIKDIHPQAPVHLLIISKKHFVGVSSATDEEKALIGEMIIGANKIAADAGLERGFRLIINNGEHAGQLVPHFHIHLLGGKRLGPKIVN